MILYILCLVLPLTVSVFYGFAALLNEKSNLADRIDEETEEEQLLREKKYALFVTAHGILRILSVSLSLYGLYSILRSGAGTVLSLILSALLVSFLYGLFTLALPMAFDPPLDGGSERMAEKAASVISVLFYPLAFPIAFLGEILRRNFSERKQELSMTQDELMSVVDEIEEDGGLSEDESELVRGAIKFADITACDIMIPRVDVKAFNLDDGAEALLKDKELLEYSRFPVYKGTIDNIVGILNTKKLVAEVFRKGTLNVDIESLLMEPFYIHMGRDLTSLMKEFRAKKYQMAVVVDEYGGTMGILTGEDMVEEIVGEIYDEGDDIEREYTKRQGGYEVDGLMTLDDFSRLCELDDPIESDYNTVGGWCAEMLQKVPEEGDTFSYRNLDITVVTIESSRVDKLVVVIRVLEPVEDTEPEENE